MTNMKELQDRLQTIIVLAEASGCLECILMLTKNQEAPFNRKGVEDILEKVKQELNRLKGGHDHPDTGPAVEGD